MLLVINICLLLLLAVVVYQDLKERQISWFLIPLLLSLFAVQGLFRVSADELIGHTLFNVCFIMVQLLVLTIYISIKNKKPVNIINSYLGLGDVLFFITVAAAFSPLNFIVFYIIGLLFTLLFFIVLKRIVKTVSTEIPLAGGMAALMIVLIILNQWLPEFNFYSDNFLTGCFIH